MDEKMYTCVNWAKNVDRSMVGENFIFFDFWKVFEIEENHHIFTSTQLKYKNADRSVVGENFSFSDFLKSFPNWRKLSYFHFNTTKIQKFIHLEEKCAHVWIETKK